MNVRRLADLLGTRGPRAAHAQAMVRTGSVAWPVAVRAALDIDGLAHEALTAMADVAVAMLIHRLRPNTCAMWRVVLRHHPSAALPSDPRYPPSYGDAHPKGDG